MDSTYGDSSDGDFGSDTNSDSRYKARARANGVARDRPNGICLPPPRLRKSLRAGALKDYTPDISTFVVQRATRTTSTTASPTWMDPKSPDWDAVRFLNSDDSFAPDNLIEFPPKNHSYIDSNGRLKNSNKYTIPRGEEKKLHPKLAAHIKNGTDTPANRLYYRDMNKKRSLPLAGIIRETPDPRDSVVRGPLECPKAPGGSTKYFFSLIFELQILTPEDEFQEENFHARPSIKLVIPDHIKAILVDDWENVTKNQQLVPLPATHPVKSILDDYLEYEKPRRQAGSAHADIVEEVVAGLKEYFEKCLGRILLYRFERNQYTEVREGWASGVGDFAGKSACETYGAEHLCRLLVTLPELIAQTNMDLQSVNRLREELSKLTNWLGRNVQTYFVSEYETPSQDYVEKARGI